jgi:hypothetical protein
LLGSAELNHRTIESLKKRKREVGVFNDSMSQ